MHDRLKGIAKIIRWPLILVFSLAGGAKLMDAGPMIIIFERFELPHWFMYVTGIVETSSAIGLLFWNRLSGFVAALALTVTMLVGAAFHLGYETIGQAIPAITLALISGFIAFQQRGIIDQYRAGDGTGQAELRIRALRVLDFFPNWSTHPVRRVHAYLAQFAPVAATDLSRSYNCMPRNKWLMESR